MILRLVKHFQSCNKLIINHASLLRAVLKNVSPRPFSYRPAHFIWSPRYCQYSGPMFFQYSPCALVNRIHIYQLRLDPVQDNQVKRDRANANTTYSQTKWSIPFEITFMNWLFEYWTASCFKNAIINWLFEYWTRKSFQKSLLNWFFLTLNP